MKVITEPVVKKRKRFNKNKKKAWRKKINISDIEDHLEEKRREERSGGPLEERISEELFSLDYGFEDNKALGEKSDTHFVFKDGMKPLYTTKKELPLKCHEFIYGLPGAKAISVKKGTMKQKEKKVIKRAKRLAQPTPEATLQRKIIQTQRRIDLVKKKKVPKMTFEKDIWNNKKSKPDNFNEISKTFLEEPILFYKVQTKQKRVKTPTIRFEKPSLIPSVIIPKSGASYNPSYDAHQKLLAEALEVENQKRKKEEKENRMIKKYLPSSTDGITEMEQILEMSEGLPSTSHMQYFEMHENEEMNIEEDQDFVGHKKIEKKSKQSRTKAKTLKVKEQKRLKKKEFKQRESNIYRIKSYQKNIKQMEEKAEILKGKKKRKRAQEKYKTKQLSRHKFEEEDVQVSLGNEIAGRLVALEPAGNPVETVYKSFQRRNLIAKTVRVMRPKRKQKMIYKSTCKEKLNLLDDED